MLFLAGALIALVLSASAQIVTFHGTVAGTNEAPPTTSPATGAVTMFYNVATNTFDLIVVINNMSNTATLSHIHEGAVGVAGPIVTNLGPEAAYVRNGTTLSAVFHNITHGGNPLTLLQGGAYYNIHSAQFPGGEARAQLIPQPKKLYANFTVAQEQAAFPTSSLTGNVAGYGAAVMYYDPMANKVSLRLGVYNFKNVLNNSHYHEGAPGVSGPVVVNLGNNANAGGYTTANGYINGTFDIPYTGGDPIKLLTGGAYLNFHSTAFPSGECRGQVMPSEETPSSRVINFSSRGFVGTGAQVLVGGFYVQGPEPVRLLVTAKGPSLSAYGITGTLSDPVLTLYDSAGRQIATNDNVGSVAGTDLASLTGVPTNSSESALLVVLPPGSYTAVVSGANGSTGIALLEALDVRTVSSTVITSSDPAIIAQLQAARGPANKASQRTSAPRGAVELCGVPLAITPR